MIKHLIDGAPVASKDTFETLNPATSEVIDEVASGGEVEVAAAVEGHRRQFRITADRPAGAKGDIGEVKIGVKPPLVTAGLSFDAPGR